MPINSEFSKNNCQSTDIVYLGYKMKIGRVSPLQVSKFTHVRGQYPKLKRPAFGLPIQFYYRSIEKEHLSNLIKKELPDKSANEIKQILSLWKGDIQKELKGLREDKIKNLFKKARQLATAYVGGKRAKEGEYTRRSSPLFIKVIKLSDNNYALLFIFMKAKLFPDKIKVEKEGKEGKGSLCKRARFLHG